jgi:WD40 repeat protein
MTLASGGRIGVFDIVAKLGEGGMGEVYRARDTRLERDVALKVLPPEFARDAERVARFRREAKTLAAINHPHIAHLHGLEETSDGSLALVMELVEGDDLAERLKHGALAVDEALPVARQIAEALEAAHEQGIVHRDLKPANIKVRPDGTVKVLDFGLAKAVEPHRGPDVAQSPTITSPAITMRGVILGTAAYMSPEQAKGKPVDRRADIWAFGCVLYERLTGARAFDGEDTTEILGAIVKTDPDWSRLPVSTPGSIGLLLRRCLEKSVTRRLPHIGSARLELAEPVVAPLPDHQPTRKRSRDLAAGALVGMAAGGLVIGLMFRAASPIVAPQPVIQLAVPMPRPTSASNGVVISPDGRYLATRGPGGASLLHAFDGSPSLPLDGVALCWSSDSRSLVLRRASGDAVKMDVAGGPAVAFAKVPATGSGCAFGRDGVLLVGGGLEPFSQVTVAGGVLTPVAHDDAGPQTRRFAPRFLPDGQRFLYFSIGPDGRRTVRAGSLDVRETTHVVESDAPAVYAAGYLFFQRGATLIAQPFDDRTLTLSGDPQAVSVESAAGSVVGVAGFDVSDTGMLVFATTNGGVRATQNWIDRRGNLIGTLPAVDDAELLNLAISPDGTRAAGTRMDGASGNWDLWSIDLRSGTPTRLTRQPGIDSDPVWSPDGAALAYVSRRADVHGLFRLSLRDGSEQLLLKIAPVTGANDTRPTDWTPDGRFLVYESDLDVLALPLSSPGEPIRVAATPAFEKSGRVSPDGRWIAFHSNDSGDFQVYVQPFPGPGTPVRVSAAAGNHPQWRGDGRELFWLGDHPDGNAFGGVFSAALTFTGDAVRGATPTLLLPRHIRISPLIDSRPHYAAAPDGERFLLRQADGVPGPAVKVILNWPELLKGKN